MAKVLSPRSDQLTKTRPTLLLTLLARASAVS